MENGWRCKGGSPTTASVCNPTCGDGVILGDEICDDLNTEDGDGCSSDCRLIEYGWKCSGEYSICYLISAPSINKTITLIGESKIGFEFNETVILDPDWSQDDWDIYIIGPMNPYIFDWTFISEEILEVPM